MVNWNSIREWIIFLWKSCCLRRSKNHNELLQVQSCLNQSVCQAPLIKPEPTGISLEWCLSGNDSLWCVKCRALFFGSCYCDSISPSILCKCINFYSISDEQKRWPFLTSWASLVISKNHLSACYCSSGMVESFSFITFWIRCYEFPFLAPFIFFNN